MIGAVAEVGLEAGVSLGDCLHGLREAGDLDLAGEGVLVKHGEDDEHLVALLHRRDLEGFEERPMAFEGAGVGLVEAVLGVDEAEPGAGLAAEGSWVVAFVERLEGGGAGDVELQELLV